MNIYDKIESLMQDPSFLKTELIVSCDENGKFVAKVKGDGVILVKSFEVTSLDGALADLCRACGYLFGDE